MDLKELKKLIEQVQVEVQEQENAEKTDPGSKSALQRQAGKSPSPQISPSADTKISSPSSAPIQSKPYQNPQDFKNGMLRLRIALQDKFLFTDKNKKISDIIDEIYQEQINKLVRDNPELEQME